MKISIVFRCVKVFLTETLGSLTVKLEKFEKEKIATVLSPVQRATGTCRPLNGRLSLPRPVSGVLSPFQWAIGLYRPLKRRQVVSFAILQISRLILLND